MQHWGIYSLLSQPEVEVRSVQSDYLATRLYSGDIVIIMHTLFFGQSQSTRNSAVYAEIGPIPKGKAAVMPDTTVQYAIVKKKQQQQQCEMGKV